MKKLEGLKKKSEDLMRKIKYYKIPKKEKFLPTESFTHNSRLPRKI